eukprot:5656003-Prymnesium_polylepis.4
MHEAAGESLLLAWPLSWKASYDMHAKGPSGSSAQFLAKNWSAFTATTARLMKKDMSSAPVDSIRAYQIASLTRRGLWREILRERTRPECR